MPEYFSRLLPVFFSCVALTPALATTYTPGLDRSAIVGKAMPSSDAAQAQTWGASYDALTGKFAIATDKIRDSTGNCGADDCYVATVLSAPAPAAVVRQTAAPASSAPSSRTSDAASGSTAVSAAANWYATTLISDAYAYNGNNNAFLIDEHDSFLSTLPDLNSWGLMLGGMIAVFFLMRRMTPSTTLAEPDAVEKAWGGPETRAREMRAPTTALKAKAIAAIPKLCCSRQALPGS